MLRRYKVAVEILGCRRDMGLSLRYRVAVEI